MSILFLPELKIFSIMSPMAWEPKIHEIAESIPVDRRMHTRKTGTTNWQRALIPLIYDGKMADFSVHNKMGTSGIPIFTFMPRFSSLFSYNYGWHYEERQNCIAEILGEKASNENYTRLINTRKGRFLYWVLSINISLYKHNDFRKMS